MSYKYKGKKDKKGKKGRKDKLRDIDDDITAQLFIEETGVEQMSSESSDDLAEFQRNPESSKASMNLGSKTATFILEKMIINPSASHCKENTTSHLVDKSASGVTSSAIDNTNTVDELKDDSNSETKSSKAKGEEEHSKGIRKRSIRKN